MNPVDSMTIFARVAELSSFTQAADNLGLPKATVSNAVQQLENQLGTRLLQRTTRKVQLTHDGQAYYERCKDMLVDMEELQGMFRQKGTEAVRGRVRIDMPTALARNTVIPHLPELLQAHPLLELEFSCTERRVDVIREGFDCVLRGGAVVDPGLIGRTVGHMPMVNCASPDYLARFGVPITPADLATHRLIHYVPTLGAKADGFDYLVDGQTLTQAMQGAMTVNNADAYQAACLAGLGLIQVPEVGVRDLLEQGRLQTVLPDFFPAPMPMTLLYANRRNLPTRVRIVMDWLVAVAQDYLASPPRSNGLP
ncbi:MAG: LysR family transcriptional regulator [Rhodoferax sp.]|nr:LysR family transcriptional regulator [Rhodoferax sp.]